MRQTLREARHLYINTNMEHGATILGYSKYVIQYGGMEGWHQTIGEHSSRDFANTITKHTVMGTPTYLHLLNIIPNKLLPYVKPSDGPMIIDKLYRNDNI